MSKKALAGLLILAGFLVSGISFAEDSALQQLQQTSQDSTSFDGGSGSTLDSPQSSQGTEPYQGNFSASANS